MSLKMSAMSLEGYEIDNVEYLSQVMKFTFREEEYTIKTNVTYFEHHVGIVTKEVFDIIIEKNNEPVETELQNEIINTLNIKLITKIRDYKWNH
jgi:hypothetical protein